MPQPITEFHRLRQLKGRQHDLLVSKLVQQNYGLVHQEAHRRFQNSRLEYEEIEQAGAIGLLKAIRNFNADSGYAFSSYAIPLIRGEILHLIRDDSTGGLKTPRQSKELLASWKKQRRSHPQFTLEQIAIADLVYRGMSKEAALTRYQQACDDCSRKTLSDVDELQIEDEERVDRTYNIQKVLAKLPHPYGFVLLNSVEMPVEAIANYLQVPTEQVDEWVLEGRKRLLQFEGELV